MTISAESSPLRQAGFRNAARVFVGRYGFLPILLVALYVGFGLTEPAFFSAANAENIIKQSSFLVILATAQMFVLITRGFDLSLGAVISTISVVSALTMVGVARDGEGQFLLAIVAGIGAALLVGAVAGAVNGACVSYLNINPFLATLGLQGIAFGLATTLSGGFPVFDVPQEFSMLLSRSLWLGFIPPPTGVCLAVLLLAYLILNHTVLGRGLYLLGANPRAAQVAGLPWRRYRMLAYVLCSITGAIGALLMTARSGTGEPSLGGGLMLQSIAAAVIGGVALRGGEGRVIHVVFGGLLVTVLSIGMNLVRIDGFLQHIVLGIVLIAAVFLDRLRLMLRL